MEEEIENIIKAAEKDNRKVKGIVHNLAEVVTVSRRFPRHIETNLQNDWPMIKSTLKEHGIIAWELDLVKCSMTFSTTNARDLGLIDRARGLLQLFSLAVPTSLALKILNRKEWKVIKLGYQNDGLCSKFQVNREQFLEQRKLLLEPSFKELVDLATCDIFVSGDIVVVMGDSAWGQLRPVQFIEKMVGKIIVCKVHPSILVVQVKSFVAEARAMQQRKEYGRQLEALQALHL